MARILALLLISHAALADDLEVARAAYQRGESAAGRGDWEAALAAFDLALAHSGRPLLHYDRGVMLERLGRAREAGEAFASYLAASPNAPEREELERFLKNPEVAPPRWELAAPAPERRRVPRWAWGLIGGGIALAVGAVVVGVTLGSLRSGTPDLQPVTFR